MPPLVEARETFVPGTELGPFLTASEGAPPKVVLGVQLVRVIIVHSVGEEIVSWPLIMDLKCCIISC